MDELNEFQKRYLQQMKEEQEKELTENSELIDSFKRYCNAKGLILNDSNFKYIPPIGIVAYYPNIVGLICNDLLADKEGLLNFKTLSDRFEKRSFISGYLYSKNFMLMAHPYFRRGFYENSNFAPRFVDLFWKNDHSDLDAFIAIDSNRVHINVDNRMYIEEDTWFGPKFNKDISQIEDGIAHLRPSAGIDDFSLSFCFNDTYSLDIKWETKNGVKSFQAEEFKTDKVKIKDNGIEYFPARYIHAEFDLKKNIFRHFDGAIHFYSLEEYFNRRDCDFNYNAKNDYKIKTASKKLFKFNGDIKVETWIEYSGHFLTGNPLLIEYVEGKYPDRITEILEAVKKNKENKNGC